MFPRFVFVVDLGWPGVVRLGALRDIRREPLVEEPDDLRGAAEVDEEPGKFEIGRPGPLMGAVEPPDARPRSPEFAGAPSVKNSAVSIPYRLKSELEQPGKRHSPPVPLEAKLRRRHSRVRMTSDMQDRSFASRLPSILLSIEIVSLS